MDRTDLHQEIKIGDGTTVRRVPGGWIYKFFQHSNTSHVFVPYSDEFRTILK